MFDDRHRLDLRALTGSAVVLVLLVLGLGSDAEGVSGCPAFMV